MAKPNAVEGKNIVYLFRLFAERATKEASAVVFQTEGKHTIASESESTATKDGNIVTTKPVTEEITTSLIFSDDNEMINKFKKAIRNNELIEIWEVNLDDPAGTGKYNGEYFQGKLTQFDLTASSEGAATYECTFSINGVGKEGPVTMSASNQEVIDYVFADTTASTQTQSKSTK